MAKKTASRSRWSQRISKISTPADTNAAATAGAARAAAIRYAGDVISDQPELLDASQAFKVEVTDDAGQALFTVVTKLEDGKVG